MLDDFDLTSHRLSHISSHKFWKLQASTPDLKASMHQSNQANLPSYLMLNMVFHPFCIVSFISSSSFSCEQNWKKRSFFLIMCMEEAHPYLIFWNTVPAFTEIGHIRISLIRIVQGKIQLVEKFQKIFFIKIAGASVSAIFYLKKLYLTLAYIFLIINFPPKCNRVWNSLESYIMAKGYGKTFYQKKNPKTWWWQQTCTFSRIFCALQRDPLVLLYEDLCQI